jgi:hypothetical protein
MAAAIEELTRDGKPHIVVLWPWSCRPLPTTVDRQTVVHGDIELRAIGTITQAMNVM